MKKFTYFVALLLCSAGMLKPQIAKASHAAGGEIVYAWVSDSTWRIYVKFYRDCGGISEPSNVTVCYYNDCNSTQSSVTCNKITTSLPYGGGTNGQEVSTGCPSGTATTCNSGSLPGYREWWYSGDVTLYSRCDKWTFFTGFNARNSGITNVTGGGTATLYIEATLNNYASQNFSSPYFTVKPVPYVCINTPYNYNNGAIDPNSDSLVFSMIMPRDGPSSCTYPPSPTNLSFTSSGTSSFNLSNNPFSTNNTFTINSATGQLSFTPDQVQIAVVTVLVKKYRNNVLLGTVMRDIQIIVLNCSSTQPTFNQVGSSFTGLTLQGGRYVACAGQPLSFCYEAKSTDILAKLVVNDNHYSTMPGSTVTYTGQATDSVRGCVSWTPGPVDTGLRIYTITIKDSTCNPPGLQFSQSYVIPIYIYPITKIFPDTSICPGDSVYLTVVGGGGFQWNVLPGGSPLSTLSCTNCQHPTAKPTITTRYTVVSNLNTFCNHNKDTVTIIVVTPPVFSAGPDTTTCVNNNLQLELHVPTVANNYYHIQWIPPVFLSSDTIDNPVFNGPVDETYYITVTPNGLARCAKRDTINIHVLQGYTLFNTDTTICQGQTVPILAVGDLGYNYKWTPGTDVANPNTLVTTITPTYLGSKTYTITASFPGCNDSINRFSINVQPGPVVNIGPGRTLCAGDTAQLNPTVTPYFPGYTYKWTPGGSVRNPTDSNTVFDAVKTTKLTLTVTTSAGCIGTDTATYLVVPAHFISLSNDTTVCPGDTIHLHVYGKAKTLTWSPPYFLDNTHSYNPNFYPVATSTLTVIATNNQNCQDTEKVTITVQPAAVLSVPDTVTIFPGDMYQVHPNGNCLYFSWFPFNGLSGTDISNPIINPDVNTHYYISARNEFGCKVTDSMVVLVNLDSYINIPNSFTPGSSPNSILYVLHRGDASLGYLRIFNRWGTKMFETHDITQGWDGTFNGEPQPLGVYVYTMEAFTHLGKRVYKQGNITLLR